MNQSLLGGSHWPSDSVLIGCPGSQFGFHIGNQTTILTLDENRAENWLGEPCEN